MRLTPLEAYFTMYNKNINSCHTTIKKLCIFFLFLGCAPNEDLCVSEGRCYDSAYNCDGIPDCYELGISPPPLLVAVDETQCGFIPPGK